MKQPPKSTRAHPHTPIAADVKANIRSQWTRRIELLGEVAELEMAAAEKREELRKFSMSEIARRTGVNHSTVRLVVGSHARVRD